MAPCYTIAMSFEVIQRLQFTLTCAFNCFPSTLSYWKSLSVTVFVCFEHLYRNPTFHVFLCYYNLKLFFATIYHSYVFPEAGGFTGSPINYTVFMPVTLLPSGLICLQTVH